MWIMITSDNRDVCQQTLRCLEPVEGENNMIIVNGGEDDYLGLEIPAGWDAIRLSEVKGTSEIMQMMFKMFPDEEYYGQIPDNCIIESVGWEKRIKDATKGKLIVSFNDGNGEPFPFTGVRIWPGKMVRQVGWWGMPSLHTTYLEWAWIKIAWDLVCWERLGTVKVTYLPRKPNQMDIAVKEHEPKDKETFDNWREKEYHKIFRRLFFENCKWTGRTNFPKEIDNGQDEQSNPIPQENGDGGQALQEGRSSESTQEQPEEGLQVSAIEKQEAA